MMEPLSMAVITRMISEYGKEAVAAFGVGGRLEALSLIGIWALSMAMTPFVGQNFGAGNSDRVRAALRFGVKILTGVGRCYVHCPLPLYPASSHQFLTITRR